MHTVIIIPARYASTRYPGKPMALLKGATGLEKTLLRRSIEAARGVRTADAVYVATDDERIAEEAARHGCPVIMTSEHCRNGTERVAEAVENQGLAADLVINLQGDAPLTPPRFVEALIAAMHADTGIAVATPALRCDREALEAFKSDRRHGRVGATTMVFGSSGDALYFSKEIVPYADAIDLAAAELPVFHHVGLYGYRRAALAAYITLPPGRLEQIEGLEQLRFLENGMPIRAVEVAAAGARFWELNNPTDIPLIERYLAAMGWE